MVSSLWKDTSFICEKHQNSKLELIANYSNTNFDYVCPICKFKLPYLKAEKFLDKLSDDLEEAEFNNTITNLQGSKYTVGTYSFKVIGHQIDGPIDVVVSEKTKKK